MGEKTIRVIDLIRILEKLSPLAVVDRANITVTGKSILEPSDERTDALRETETALSLYHADAEDRSSAG